MNYRLAYFLAFLACAGLLGYAYYLQHYQFYDPCPLCIFQRVAFMWMGAFFLLGAIHGPRNAIKRVYAIGAALGGLAGISIAGRHIWLQNLPADQVPACGPGLDYMIDTLPFADVLRQVFTGSGECAVIDWSFLGLSMPWWTLIWFVGLTLWALVFGWRIPRRSLFRD